MRVRRFFAAAGLAALVLLTIPGMAAGATAARDTYDLMAAFGSASEYFTGCYDMMSAPDGTLWVLDQSRERLLHLSAAGATIRVVGGPGAGNGRFLSPTAIAIAPSGDIFVADSGNSRVQCLDSSGAYKYKFGGYGTGDGQFSSVYGVAVDPSGNVWVSEAGNNRVQKLSSTGAYLAKLGGTASGSGDGQFSQPAKLSCDSAGLVYVADQQNHRIQVLSNACTYLRQFGTMGGGDAQFSYPNDVFVTPTGAIYVSDNGNSTIKAFAYIGGAYQFVRSFGAMTADPFVAGSIQSPYAVDVDGSGTVRVMDWWGLRSFASDGTPGSQLVTGGTGSVGLGQPRGLAVAADGTVWMGESPGGLRKMRFAGSHLTSVFATETLQPGDVEIGTVADVAVDSSGNVYLVDSGYSRVVKLDSAGNVLHSWGAYNTTAGNFRNPNGLCVANDRIYVADSSNHRVQVFDLNGSYLAQFGVEGPADNQFSYPSDVAVFGSTIYVVDGNTSQVKIWTESTGPLSYAFADTFGGYGSDEGSLMAPNGIVADVAGDVYVASGDGHSVDKFNSKGALLSRIDGKVVGQGTWHQPWGVALDSAGRLFVTDTMNCSLVVVAPRVGTTCWVSAPASAVNAGGSGTVRFGLRDAYGAAIRGYSLEVDASVNGGLSWAPVAYVTSTDSSEFSAAITTRTKYRVRFAGANYYVAATSSAAEIAPRLATLSNPKAPTSAKRGTKFKATGTFGPRHASGAKSIRILAYRKVGRVWKAAGSFSATNANYGSLSAYSAKFSLSKKGSYRLRAYAPADSQHAATYSAGYAYIKVK